MERDGGWGGSLFIELGGSCRFFLGIFIFLFIFRLNVIDWWQKPTWWRAVVVWSAMKRVEGNTAAPQYRSVVNLGGLVRCSGVSLVTLWSHQQQSPPKWRPLSPVDIPPHARLRTRINSPRKHLLLLTFSEESGRQFCHVLKNDSRRIVKSSHSLVNQ